jgi:hypothetical protein
LPDEEEEEGVRVNFAMKMTGITEKKKKDLSSNLVVVVVFEPKEISHLLFGQTKKGDVKSPCLILPSFFLFFLSTNLLFVGWQRGDYKIP